MPEQLEHLFLWMIICWPDRFSARILVDVDLQYGLLLQIMVERKAFALVVDLEYFQNFVTPVI